MIVSDNASTDETTKVCRYYCDKDHRFRYIRRPENLGANANFSHVLELAAGDFFMWLGDDDWIDANYIGTCVQQLIFDSAMSLVSGAPKYYRNGQIDSEGKVFCLLHNSWWRRVVSYYCQVTDNGMFYGLMRTTQLRQIKIPKTMGGDWFMIANIVSTGKAMIIPEICIHRELGGATASFAQMVKMMGLPKIQALFPMSSIAVSAWMDIMANDVAYKNHSIGERLLVASIVFVVIFIKKISSLSQAITRKIRKFLIKSDQKS